MADVYSGSGGGGGGAIGETVEETFTAEEKEAVRKSSLPHLRMISNAAKTPILSAFVTVLENAKTTTEILSSTAAPIFNFVGALYKQKFGKNALLHLKEEAAIFSSTVKFVDLVLDLFDDLADSETTALDFNTKMVKAVNETFKISEAFLKKDGDKGIFMSIATGAMSYGISVMSTLDGIEPEEQAALNKAAFKLGITSITSAFKEMGKNTEKFTAPFGLASLGISAITGLIEGIAQMGIRADYYRADGLPEDFARNEALLDALVSGLHETFSTYLKGLDDAVFNITSFVTYGMKWLDEQTAAFFTDKNYSAFEYTANEKNYMEWIREAAKRGAFGTSDVSDTIEIDSGNSSLYAQDGDDRIYNMFPNVTIYGGHGNDSISLYEGAIYNSVFGGNGEDYLYTVYHSNTIDGGADNDRFLILGNKNKLDGAEGREVFFVKGNANTVTGGAGNDLIDLNGATKSVIEYTAGDGTDAVYGYGTDALFKITGNYSTQVSGNDVIIQVGKGGIIVKDAKDLRLNINKIEPEEIDLSPSDTEGGFTPFGAGLVLMPSFWDDGNAVRGTNTNDMIENTLSNIMLYGFSGNDTIINYGNNVTINAGAGNDHIENYGESVTINGGADHDYILNEASNVVINGDDGDDTIENAGSNSVIDGGNGMDSITNSGENTDINSGAGKDRILNSASNSRVYGWLDDNYITNTKAYVTLEGGDDNDYIFNSGDYVYIDAGAGNNSVSVDGSASGDQSIYAGAGDDTVQVGERDETEEKRYYNHIDMGEGNNYIDNSNVERSTISAGAGNDTIITGGGEYYYGDWTWINAGAGDNLITVNSSMTYGEIYAGGGNDFVSVEGGGEDNIVSVGGGNDSVISDIDSSTINVGAGDNFVSLHSEGDDIIAGSGNDYVIITYGGNTSSLGSGNNTLVSENGRETVFAGNGDDVITVKSGYINVGDGKNDIVILYGGNTEIYSGGDDDTINVADKAEEATDARNYHNINAGEGNNYINNSNVERSTISAGAGNDTIITGGGEYYYGDWTWINAGAGDNLITVNSSMTYGEIYAGGGNDFVSIESGGKWNVVSVGGGNDSVISDVDSSTINVGAGDNFVSLYSEGDDIIAGSGNDYVIITGGGNTASLGNGNNTLVSENGREIVFAGDGDDVITVKSGHINVGDGKNDIVILYGGDTTIYSGNDDDTINVADKAEEATDARNYHNINAGEGNNYINNSNVELSTISAGAGNDTIITGGGEYYYGDWTWINAGAGDNLITVNGSMTYGEIYASGGNDFVLIEGDGDYNVISVGAGRNTVFTHHYYDTNYNVQNTLEAGTGSDVIYTGGNNGFINAGSGRNLITLVGGYDNTIVTGNGNDTLRLGADAGNNVIIFGGGNDIVEGYHSSDTVKGAGALTKRTVGTDVILTDGTSSMTLKGAADKTVNTAALSSGDNVYKILVADKTAGDSLLPDGSAAPASPDTIAPEVATISNSANNMLIVGTTNADTIINAGTNVTINAGSGDDYIKNSGASVTVQAGAGDDTVTHADLYQYWGGNDVITAFEDSDRIQLSNAEILSSTLEGNDLIVYTTRGSITIKNADAGQLTIVDRNGNAIDLTQDSTVDTDTPTIEPEVATISNSANNTLIVGTTNADTIINAGTNVTINAGSGDDYIKNSGASVTVQAGAGDDTVTHADLYQYWGGNDVITAFEDNDRIQLLTAEILSSTLEGNDLVLYTTRGSITIKNADARQLTIVDRNGNETNNFYGREILTENNVDNIDGAELNQKKTILTLFDTFKGNVDASNFSKKLKTIDALAMTTAVEIIGNAQKNNLYAGSGGSTLNGGGGADKLYGGDGADVFVYDGQGKDVIYNYDSEDRIALDGAMITSSKVSGKKVVLSVGKQKLTIEDALNKWITITDADGMTSTYEFTKKNKTLDKALLSTVDQFSTADYWFDSNPIEQSPLNEIISMEEAIDLSTDLLSPPAQPFAIADARRSARKQSHENITRF